MGSDLTMMEVVDSAYLLAEELSGSIVNVAVKFGLTAPRLQLLFVLAHNEPLIQRDIALHLKCSQRQVTALVDALEASGFVSRIYSSQDRRSRTIALTKQGAAITDEVEVGRRAAVEYMLAGLSADDVQAFGRVAHHLIEKISGAELSRLDHH